MQKLNNHPSHLISKTFLVNSISRFILFSLLTVVGACANVRTIDNAKLSLLSSVDKKAFSFVVSEEFIKNNSGSDPSSLYPKMSNAELKLLMRFLESNKYCINAEGDILFKISSRQEKIYDITFSSVIEQSYNAKPVIPVTYFGECL